MKIDLCNVLQIPVLLYHGTQQERLQLAKKINKRDGALQIYPVVVTSFEIAMRDRPTLQVLYNIVKICALKQGTASCRSRSAAGSRQIVAEARPLSPLFT